MQQSPDRDLLILIHDVGRTLRTRFDQTARATHAMTRAQWIILSRLARQPGMSQNELAAICEVEPITIARLVDRLEARGLVERSADAGDRRAKKVALTRSGRALITRIFNKHKVDLDAAAGGLTRAERETLIALLKKLGLTADAR